MTEPLIVRPEAERDIAEAFDWYEAKKPGLGFKFISAVEDAFSAIQQHPLAFATIHAAVRLSREEGIHWFGSAAFDEMPRKARAKLDRCEPYRAQ